MEFAGKKIAMTGAGREFGRTLAVNFAKRCRPRGKKQNYVGVQSRQAQDLRR